MIMVGKLTELNQNFMDRINSMVAGFNQVDINQGIYMAKHLLYGQLGQQSHLWAYIDTFRTFAVACLIVIPFIMFITPPKINSLIFNS